MSFQPVLPDSGIAGWQFLVRTRAAQQAVFNRTGPAQRDAEYFAQNIHRITSAEQLIDDPRLLRVALAAFGLEADIRSKAFIRKVLEDGTDDPASLANRLADKRYHSLSETFGFGQIGLPNTQLPDFASRIIAAYRERQFETAVGEQRPELRHALAFSRDLSAAISRQSTDRGRWYAIMGNPPLREVFQTALGLPKSFASLDLDRQLDGFRQAAQTKFGTSELSQLSTPNLTEKILRQFLVRAQIAAAPSSSAGQVALTLLQAARPT